MFVAPRPMVDDDPLFPVRAAIMPVIGFAVGMALQSPLAAMYPTLMFGLLVSNRKAFDVVKVIAGPAVFVTALWLMSLVVLGLQGIPVTLFIVLAVFYFVAFYLIQRTGNALGMLIIIALLMMTVMAFTSYQAMDMLRVEMTKAAIATIIAAIGLYAILPAATQEKIVDVMTPSYEHGWEIRAAIRALVLIGYTMFLVTILDVSSLMLGVTGLYVLCHSTRGSIWGEAWQRIFAVLVGGMIGLFILTILQASSHLVVLLGAVFLATLWLANRMMTGQAPYRVYQDAISVMLSLVAGGVGTAEPGSTFVVRAGLTLVGTLAAAFMVTILDTLLVKPVKEPLTI